MELKSKMCGITGIYGLEDKELIKRMTDVIDHRGPDDKGYFIDKEISLGVRRLSIIDVKGGKQPIFNENQDKVIIFNGEIYNYKELKQELENKGHRFGTNSDTEVIVHCYEEFGERCVDKLRGMFAFAIYDLNNKKLFIARDRLGIKPLYYCLYDNKFVFGSEIKSILQFVERREIDYKALDAYFAMRFVFGERTLFNGIKRLMPGHYLEYDGKDLKIKKYWEFSINESNYDSKYYEESLMKLIEESVRIRLMSEVPLGAYLSGGVDSSTIVGVMSKFMDEPVKTFSVGFGYEEEEEELKMAKFVSEHFGTDHEEIIVKTDAIKFLPRIVWHFDEPVADPAAVPTYLLSERAKKKVTVVLTGEGGDEMFAGYEHYKIMKIGERFKKLPRGFLKFVPKLASVIPGGFLNLFFKYSERLGEEGINRFGRYLDELNNRKEAYCEIINIFDKKEKEEFYSDKLKEFLRNYKAEEGFNTFFNDQELLKELINLEINTELPEDLLMKVDKMTMAHSVEARVPFLDHKLVEFAATIPSNFKLNGVKDKYILRRCAARILPREIFNRKKQRFFVPLDIWFKEDLRGLVENFLSESNVVKRGFFNYNYIKKILGNYEKSRLFYGRQLWSILNFEMWHRIFIENDEMYRPDFNKIF